MSFPWQQESGETNWCFSSATCIDHPRRGLLGMWCTDCFPTNSNVYYETDCFPRNDVSGAHGMAYNRRPYVDCPIPPHPSALSPVCLKYWGAWGQGQPQPQPACLEDPSLTSLGLSLRLWCVLRVCQLIALESAFVIAYVHYCKIPLPLFTWHGRPMLLGRHSVYQQFAHNMLLLLHTCMHGTIRENISDLNQSVRVGLGFLLMHVDKLSLTTFTYSIHIHIPQ